jgi:hypothetical protein
MAADAVVTATSTDAKRAAEMRLPPLADLHIKVRPTRLIHAHAKTYEPKVKLIACAPPTAISPADAARENIKSRRDGTWKECRTRTDTRSTVSGSSTFAMPDTGPLTARTNHTEAAIAPPATRSFIHPGGWDLVA